MGTHVQQKEPNNPLRIIDVLGLLGEVVDDIRQTAGNELQALQLPTDELTIGAVLLRADAPSAKFVAIATDPPAEWIDGGSVVHGMLLQSNWNEVEVLKCLLPFNPYTQDDIPELLSAAYFLRWAADADRFVLCRGL